MEDTVSSSGSVPASEWTPNEGSTSQESENSRESLGEAVDALRFMILAIQRFRQALAEHFNLGLSETIAMTNLTSTEPLTARELAERVGLTPSTITSLVDRLERDGMVIRVPHETDRRKTNVTLTEYGTSALAYARQWLTAVFSDLSPSQLGDATAMLNHLAVSMEEQAGAIGRGELPQDLS